MFELFLWVLNYFNGLEESRNNICDIFEIRQNVLLRCSNCHRRRTFTESSFVLLLPFSLPSSGVQSFETETETPTETDIGRQGRRETETGDIDSASTASSGDANININVELGCLRSGLVGSGLSGLFRVEGSLGSSSATTREYSLTEISTDDDLLSGGDDQSNTLPSESEPPNQVLLDQVLVVSDLYNRTETNFTKEKGPVVLAELLNK